MTKDLQHYWRILPGSKRKSETEILVFWHCESCKITRSFSDAAAGVSWDNENPCIPDETGIPLLE